VEQKYPHVKVQMVSGFSDDRFESKAGGLLHQNMLHKPYSSYTLLMRVRSLLD